LKEKELIYGDHSMKVLRPLGAVCACLFSLSSLSAHAAAISGQGTWETTLQARDLDGNLTTVEAYYDTVLDITWLDDASLARTLRPWDQYGKRSTWDLAMTWAAGLDAYGVTGWRLPKFVDAGGCSSIEVDGGVCGFNVRTGSAATTVYNELGSMFYDTLGNIGQYDTNGVLQTSYGLTNTGPFAYLQSAAYWTGTERPSTVGVDYSYLFYMQNGYQSASANNVNYRGWAVHDGDVGAAIVPIPASLWLFSTGLLGLISISRKNKATQPQLQN